MNRNDQSFLNQVDGESTYSESKNTYHKWYYNHWVDYIYLVLGNCCAWCDRTAQQIKLEVDHVIPVLRFGANNTPDKLIRDFLAGEELRLLCVQCHLVRHAL